MLEIAGIEVEMANQLDTASLTQELESTASMILLELVTNIIKHAKASKAYSKLERTEKELILTVRDDGCGFASIKGMTSIQFEIVFFLFRRSKGDQSETSDRSAGSTTL